MLANKSTQVEPTLHDLLDDPIIQKIMKRDGVEAETLRTTIEHIKQVMADRRMAG